MQDIIKLLLIGAGSRGMEAYGTQVLNLKDKVKFVGVAEPIVARLEKFSKLHNIPKSHQFNDWKPLFDAKIEADAVLICTQDRFHKEPAIAAMKAGYEVLLEKPMAENLEDCIEIVKNARETKKHLQICHVLRFTGFFRTIYNAISQGKIGDIISITHRENVAHYHMAHSFVRGNWRNKELSSPMILAKCCHDLDLIYWFVGSRCKELSSFGDLKFFKEENAPEGAAKRCIDCKYKDSCEFSAYHIYSGKPFLNLAMNSPHSGILGKLAKIRVNAPNFTKKLAKIIPAIQRTIPWREWPTNVITEDLTEDGIEKAIAEGPYGRCVWHCDNNVVDHQMVTMLFENGIPVNLLMHGHSPIEGRSLRIDGTKGAIIARFFGLENSIELIEHGTMKHINLFEEGLSLEGHGGGDEGIIKSFVKLLQDLKENNGNKKIKGLTNYEDSFESHLIALMAEKARLEHKIIDLSEVRKSLF